ncbi:hypothetical protein [Mediterraneibacter faecis]|jgi:hypothetical protein|uniref:hypothetical protein n=1 Tax=Mediterraneibacter faecis TaxID=592978 RepID=UPI0022E411AD|nr:hypothetical protein [Mediterraneibacter faecis]
MTEKKSISHFFKPGIVLVLGIWMLLGIQTTVYAEESGDDGAVVSLDGTEQKQTNDSYLPLVTGTINFCCSSDSASLVFILS